MSYDKKQLGKKIIAGKNSRNEAHKKKAPLKKKAASGPLLTRALCQPIAEHLPPCELVPSPPVGAASEILTILGRYSPEVQNEILAHCINETMKTRHQIIDQAESKRGKVLDELEKAHVDCKRLHEILEGAPADQKIIPVHTTGVCGGPEANKGMAVNGMRKY